MDTSIATRTATSTKVLLWMAVGAAAAFGLIGLEDVFDKKSDPVDDPSTFQYCVNKCLVGETQCHERGEADEVCWTWTNRCLDSCRAEFFPPGYEVPGYVPPVEEVPPGYVPVGYVVPGYVSPIEYLPAGYVRYDDDEEKIKMDSMKDEEKKEAEKE